MCHLVQTAEPREARFCEVSRDLAFPFLGIVILDRGRRHVVRHLAAVELLLDGAPREGMVQESVLDPEAREDTIVDPREAAGLFERGGDLLPREARLREEVLRFALRERTAEGLPQDRQGVTRLLRLRPPTRAT